jgi:hypothetical protein
MINYTEDKLRVLGYNIKNAKITSVDLSMADHGCLTLCMGLKGSGWGCVYGGYCLGNGYVGAETFKGSAMGMEYLMRIMDTMDSETLNDLVGRYVRVATKGWGDTIKIIGNIINDKWFDSQSFFTDKEKENELD